MNAQEIQRVAVIGAGVMGHSIAQVFAQAGIEVNLMDIKKDLLDHALKLAKGNLQTLAAHGRVRSEDIPSILSRIHPATDLFAAVKKVDFVLEAVTEVAEVKKEVFRQLDEASSPTAVLASNTSGLDIFSIAEVKNPSRLVTAHWYAPPHIVPLVEVAPGPRTSPEVTRFTAALMERIGKKAVVMRQFVRGYIVNRLQNAIIQTVMELIENSWAAPEEIDLAVKTSLGVRLPIVGVVQSMDFNGLDVVNDFMKNSGKNIRFLEEKVRKGHLGAKTARGIYDYGGRREEEILRKRDDLFLRNLGHLEKVGAFEPV